MLVVLCIGVILSILCLVIFQKWWSWAIPWICAYLLEYGMRINRGRFEPPLYKTISAYLKPKRPQIIEQKTKVAFKINHISQLTIRDFIQCKFFGNYDSLKLHIALYHDNEIENHFAILCQQYQEAKKESHITEYANLKGGLMAIEYGWAVVNIWANMLNERYSVSVADGLRKLYPQFKFSKEGWRNDLEQVKMIEETQGAIKHMRFETALTKLESTSQSKEVSNKDQYSNFLATIRDCSKLFGTIDINVTYMDMLAVYEIGLAEEIKRLERQIKENQ